MNKKSISAWSGGSILMGAMAAFAAFSTHCTSMGMAPDGERLERMKASPRYSEGHFRNDAEMPEKPNFFAVMWKFLWNKANTEPAIHPATLDRQAADFDRAPIDGLRITWFGHASVLLELDGKKILLDPVWGQRVSPVGFAGPQRFYAPPMPLEELSRLQIDAVVISHDHYDHLDYPTIMALAKTETIFIVPLGVGSHLEYWGISKERIKELDWWDSVDAAGIRYTATPAQHFSGRTLSDRDTTLWAGFAIQGKSKKIFYSGDTGYFAGFKEIGKRLGPFDLSIMAIGAYDKQWAAVHLTPEEAVQAHKDIGGGLFLPVHWGTFNLAFHPWTEPIQRTLQAARENGVEVVAPAPGEILEGAHPVAFSRWWEETKLAENAESAGPAGLTEPQEVGN
ncbi:MAG: MBL fold metallo-hydrolase [Leptospiraceae bacterium]|nr:MBL fold metallo-hydrolase [Leptospiraceae bacterium]